MDNHQHDQKPSSEPSVKDLANIMDLELNDQDPVANSYETERLEYDAEFDDDSVIDVESIGEEDHAFHDEFDPEKNRAKYSLQSNGFAKTAVIVGGTLCLIGAGALLFQSQLPKEKVANAPEKKDPVADKVETAQTAAIKAQQSESETKAELALAKQRDSLAQPSNANSSPQPTTASQTAESPKTPSVVVASPSTTLATVTKTQPSRAAAKRQSTALEQNSFASQSNQSNAFRAAQKAIDTKPQQANKAPQIARNTAATKMQPMQQPGIKAASKDKDNNGKSQIAKARELEETSGSPKSDLFMPETEMTNRPNERIATVKPPGGSTAKEEIATNRTAPTNTSTAPAPELTPADQTISVASELPPITEYMKEVVDGTPASTSVATDSTTTSPSPVAVAPTANNVATITNPQVIHNQLGLSHNKSGFTTVSSPGVKPSNQVAVNKNNSTFGLTSATSGNNSAVSSVQQKTEPTLNFINNPTSLLSTTGGSNKPTVREEITTNKTTTQADVAEISNGRPGLLLAGSLTTGTSAKGSTMMPILWSGDGTTSNAKFVLKLDEPLLASNRRAALPAGTQLIVMAKPASNNLTIANVEVVSIIVGGKEYAAPPGALVIRDDANGLLIGEDFYKREDQIAGRNGISILTRTISTVGTTLNRPNSTSTFINSGNGTTSTSTITNGNSNLLGATLEGAFKDIPTIWEQRNQNAIAELANKPKVYQVPKDRSIRVFVNRPINF
jgi:hypothetical protein